MTAKTVSDELRKRLDRALRLAGNTHTIDDINQAIARGSMQCFVTGDSFVITEIIKAPQKTYLNVFLAVGDLSVTQLIPDIEKFAEQSGCAFIQTLGRTGWKAFLPESWKPTHTLYVKEIGSKYNG